MDIANVRRHFQKPASFSVLTPYNKSLSRVLFNLSQGSLRDEINLHITSDSDLNLIGHLIKIANQTYIVYRQLGEPFSTTHYLYNLLPAISIVSLAEITTAKNAIGSAPPTIGLYKDYFCFINSYATAELQRPTQQVTQMYQQEFVLANKSIDLSKTYKLAYLGQAYKIKSKLLDNGLVKIFAVEDV